MFDSKQRSEIIINLQQYFSDELEHELGQFDAEFLLDFLIKKLGPAFYNKGLEDAKAILERKVLDIGDELYEIEMPLD
ncbi:DUF2164 domain-containing protein [Vibrio methylphosphonaticus]|uniref:DUF2164 domain-containing protein n=1 Tax=Vibrio methylphosphonaticus TaxID=2946866 RepID=UPI002029DA20|nr:DUF2164 domain-containing protein [Vibrio methylphosphonaticus]MCL9776615.1 DUF2164 domain-containing protein [Vibrio methylphosphonaticus]